MRKFLDGEFLSKNLTKEKYLEFLTNWAEDLPDLPLCEDIGDDVVLAPPFDYVNSEYRFRGTEFMNCIATRLEIPTSAGVWRFDFVASDLETDDAYITMNVEILDDPANTTKRDLTFSMPPALFNTLSRMDFLIKYSDQPIAYNNDINELFKDISGWTRDQFDADNVSYPVIVYISKNIAHYFIDEKDYYFFLELLSIALSGLASVVFDCNPRNKIFQNSLIAIEQNSYRVVYTTDQINLDLEKAGRDHFNTELVTNITTLLVEKYYCGRNYASNALLTFNFIHSNYLYTRILKTESAIKTYIERNSDHCFKGFEMTWHKAMEMEDDLEKIKADIRDLRDIYREDANTYSTIALDNDKLRDELSKTQYLLEKEKRKTRNAFAALQKED